MAAINRIRSSTRFWLLGPADAVGAIPAFNDERTVGSSRSSCAAGFSAGAVALVGVVVAVLVTDG